MRMLGRVMMTTMLTLLTILTIVVKITKVYTRLVTRIFPIQHKGCLVKNPLFQLDSFEGKVVMDHHVIKQPTSKCWNCGEHVAQCLHLFKALLCKSVFVDVLCLSPAPQNKVSSANQSQKLPIAFQCTQCSCKRLATILTCLRHVRNTAGLPHPSRSQTIEHPNQAAKCLCSNTKRG